MAEYVAAVKETRSAHRALILEGMELGERMASAHVRWLRHDGRRQESMLWEHLLSTLQIFAKLSD
ncbi:MAG: hypothetical protein PVI91_14310 [Gammaproteobacteria bacterium]